MVQTSEPQKTSETFNTPEPPLVLFATSNPGKLEEGVRLGRQAGVTVVGPGDIGVEVDVKETGETFEENAVLKARAAVQVVQEAAGTKPANHPASRVGWCVGDDSGLMIDALGGAPGVKTRRWGGWEMSDGELYDKIVEEAVRLDPAERSARLCSTAVAYSTDPLDPPRIHTGYGQLEGQLQLEPISAAAAIPGLPDAQLFWIPEIGMTYAEYLANPDATPAFRSHRSQALGAVFAEIRGEET